MYICDIKYHIMYKLYILYSTVDFKIRYVGITGKSLEKRLYHHLKGRTKTCNKYIWRYEE